MLIISILLLSLNPSNSKPIDHLYDLKWKNRVLVIIANEKEEIQDLVTLYNNELNERDFVVIRFDGEKAFVHDTKMSKRFSHSIIKKVRKVPQEVYFVLIGKDGRIKNVYPKDININEIFSDVDKMPMRLDEMKRNPDGY